MLLALAHPILLLHIRLTEVAVEGAAPGAVVLPLDRQAVASRQANYSPPGAQGRPIAAGMHQPAAQQTHQGTEPWAVMTGLHTSRQRCAGAGGAAEGHQSVQSVRNHQRCDRRELDHLMPQGSGVLSPSKVPQRLQQLRA